MAGRDITTDERHWGSLEAREGPAAMAASHGAEFTEPPALHPPTAIERREFLKLMGASLMLGTLGCARKPVEKIIPYVNQPEELTPGVASWYSSTCAGCCAGCGLLVKTREGRPIKLEGNPAHPINRGGLCARGQGHLLGLYDPDRLREPMRGRRDGTFTAVAWADADTAISAQCAEIRQAGGKVVVWSGSVTSPTTRQLIAAFLQRFQAGEHVEYEPAAPEAVQEANVRTYGTSQVPRYRFEAASVIVTFGADFLGTWISPVEFAKAFGEHRHAEQRSMGQLIAFEAGLSLTGTNADRYVPVRAGDEVAVALALAHELIVQRQQSRYAGDAALRDRLAPYAVEQVAGHTGVAADAMRETVEALWQARSRGLVLGGPPRGMHDVALQVVVNLLNSALENDGATIDHERAPSQQVRSAFAAVRRVCDEMRAGRVAALVVYRTDPLFTMPAELDAAAAFARVPLVICCDERMHATAAAADWICPDVDTFEGWNDAEPHAGLWTLFQPTIAPLHNVRPFQDSLLQWGGLGETSWYTYLRAEWEGRVRQLVGSSQSPRVFWETALQTGFVTTEAYRQATTTAERLMPARGVRSGALGGLPRLTRRTAGELRLVLYASVAQFDGRAPNNGWLQELPDPVTKISWGNYLSIAPKTAKRLGVKDGDVVRLSVGKRTVELPVHRQPKLHESTVMVAVGYGQRHAGRIGDGVGADVYPLQQLADGPVWGGMAVTVEKSGRVHRLALMQDHHAIEGRPIVQETTLAAYLDDPAAGRDGTTHPLESMWPEHQYPGHKWGMAIDLSTCIGCHACMVACQAENNVPIVGRDQVIRGRDMHWLRIDRYYSGDVDNPAVVFQPMLCQQCDNAPCETVCPTLATVHSQEGLNIQAYNRCVGTRYCANNCPYKVRRFNYFEYSKQYVEPLNLVLNPDVVVRSRGVMEKCTFCVQRIKEGKGVAKDHGRERVIDGEILTACQQSCPTEAITFGDMNDPASRVAQLRKSPRGFSVLAELNTRPNVTYLTKVRNG